jgi:hypothetical protein
LKKVLLASTLAAVLAFSAAAAASTSPAAYRAQVNGICAKGVAALNAIPQPKKPADLYPYFKKAVALSDKLVLKIAAVTPPQSLQKSVGHAIDLQVAFQKALHVLVAQLKTSSDPKATYNAAAPGLNSLNTKANKAWNAAGLVKCG